MTKNRPSNPLQFDARVPNPVHFGQQWLNCVESESKIAREMLVMAELLPALPGSHTQEVFAAHEHDVECGRYEHLVPAAGAKFKTVESELSRNPDFRLDWTRVLEVFDVRRYADQNGIVRRSLSPERNYRIHPMGGWSDPDQRFQATFDTLCAKWNLYGAQSGEPLLLKFSVNLTPHGTMIFIPAYWSFDPKRDVNWAGVARLHRSRGQQRQGPALAESSEQRRKDSLRLARLDRDAITLGLRGLKRHEFLCSGLGWDARTDPKRLTALRKLYRSHLNSKTTYRTQL